MKAGHRACYMSRAFAQQHNFIPKDAAPGFYGFSGITNLGTWPIKVSPPPPFIPRARADGEGREQVGKKTVEQQVMLVENSYFPIILGRYAFLPLSFSSSLSFPSRPPLDPSWSAVASVPTPWTKPQLSSWIRERSFLPTWSSSRMRRGRSCPSHSPPTSASLSYPHSNSRNRIGIGRRRRKRR